MTTIKKVLDGFNSKTLSFTEYLLLMNVPTSASAFLAYTEFNNIRDIKGKIEAQDIKKFIDDFNTQIDFVLEKYIRENLEDPEPAITTYCNKVCVCVNTALLNIIQQKKQNAEYWAKWNSVDLQNKIAQWIVKYKRQEYDDVLYPNEKQRLDDVIVMEGVRSGLDKPETQDPKVWIQTWKVDHTDYVPVIGIPIYWYQYFRIHTDEYKNKQLSAFREQNYPHKDADKIKYPEPITAGGIFQCCSNTVIAYENANVKNVLQGCEQKVISNEIQKQLEEEAKREADDKKREADDKKREAEREVAAAAADEKKKFFIILACVVIVIILGGVGIFLFMSKDGAAVSKELKSPPSVNSTP